jgi:hypothetical protein
MMFAQLLLLDAEIGAFELLRIQPAEADLIELRALAHPHAETARRDFGVERPFIASFDTVEHIALVGDEAGENIEPAGRAFRVGDRRNTVRQIQMLCKWDHIDAAMLQDGAFEGG